MPADWIPTLRAVFFDVDNTLVDRDEAFLQVLPTWLTKYAPDVQDDDYAQHIKMILLADNRGHTDRLLFCGWLQDRYQIAATTKEALAVELAGLIAQRIAPQPAIFTMLEYMRVQFSLGVISNGGGKIQRAKLKHAGLSHCFAQDHIYIEGEKGFAKPHRSIFALAIQEHNIPPRQILFVGDHPVNDIAGAANAGMRTCWVRNNQPFSCVTTLPDLTIDTIHELLYHFHPRTA